MFEGSLFWFVMGMLFVLVAVGARAWARSLGLKMRWWKWLLTAAWYGMLLMTVSVPMTLTGESEGSAGLRIFVGMVVVTVILGVGLARLLLRGRRLSE